MSNNSNTTTNKASDRFNNPEAVMEIVSNLNQLIDRSEDRENGRMLPRRKLVRPILVQMLDEKRTPCGKAFEALSQDLSMGGIGFLSLGKVTGSYALVQFRSTLGPHTPLLIEIRHTTKAGPFWKVGGRFSVDWSA